MYRYVSAYEEMAICVSICAGWKVPIHTWFLLNGDRIKHLILLLALPLLFFFKKTPT